MAMYPIVSIPSQSGIVTPTLSNIPQNFTHLQLRMHLRDTNVNVATSAFLRFNNDTTNTYWMQRIFTDGATGSTTSNVNFGGYLVMAPIPSNTTALVYGTVIVDILDYTSTSKTKAVRWVGGYDANGSGYAAFGGGIWNSTAAINAIQCGADSSGNATFTRIDLYGITGSGATGA